jgi:hypothetical protein
VLQDVSLGCEGGEAAVVLVVRRPPRWASGSRSEKVALSYVAPRTSRAMDFGSPSSGGWWVAGGGTPYGGKPLAGGDSHDINDATGVVLLEGDIEVYSPSLSSLSRVKT